MSLMLFETAPDTTLSWLLYLLLAFLLLTIVVGAVTSREARADRLPAEPADLTKPAKAPRRTAAPKKPAKQP